MRFWPVTRARQRLFTCRVRDLLTIGAFFGRTRPALASPTDLADPHAATQGLIYARLCLMGDPSQRAALPPSDSRTRAFGGLNPLEGFLPLPSEGYHISKARTSSMADLPLLRKFPLCIRPFYFRCSRTHPHFWERTTSVCIIHLCSVFARPPTLFLLYSLLAYFSFLFSRAPLCSVYLQGYIFGGLSIWKVISMWRDPSSFSPPSSFLPPYSFLSFSEDSMISLTNATSCVKNWRN
jgi:hypothetical protein